MSNTPETYAELLRARGDVPISVLRQIHGQLGSLLEFVDTLDNELDIPAAPNDTAIAIAAALKARYPDFKDMADEDVLAYFKVQVNGRS